MVSYFPFDFNHIGRGVTREDPPFDMRRRFGRLFRIAFLKQLDTFFHTLWHLLKEGSNDCVIESVFPQLHSLWGLKRFESIPRLIVSDEALRHRLISRLGKE